MGKLRDHVVGTWSWGTRKMEEEREHAVADLRRWCREWGVGRKADEPMVWLSVSEPCKMRWQLGSWVHDFKTREETWAREVLGGI